MSLLQMSISGAILILAVAIIRAVAINRLPKKTFLVLWGIVLFRLLIPFSIPSVFSVYSLIGQNTVVRYLDQTPADNFTPIMQGGPIGLTGEISDVSPIHVSLWPMIWLVGMAFCTAFCAVSFLRCRFEFSTSLPVQNDFVKKWLEEHQLTRTVSIRQSDRISAPLTYGMIKPVILMPRSTDWENTKQLQYVFLHEYVHIRRFDTVTKMISTFALCVHWFNPLVWVMYLLFNRDIELACDESVVRLFGETSKKDYSLVLINMEARKSGLLPFCNNFSKNAIEERITAIMKIKKTSFISVLIGIMLITVVVTACAVTVPDTQGKSSVLSQSVPDTQEKSSVVSQSEEQTEILVYIEKFDGTTLAFDRIEWVTVPGERATELNITEDDAPSGFYIHNETATVEEFPLVENCVCKILDWTSNFTQMDVTPDELASILEERKGTHIPYHVVIKKNEIVEIVEQYVP